MAKSVLFPVNKTGHYVNQYGNAVDEVGKTYVQASAPKKPEPEKSYVALSDDDFIKNHMNR